MKCFSIKTPVCVKPVNNYCSVNKTVCLSAPHFYNLSIEFHRISHTLPHVAWVPAKCHV